MAIEALVRSAPIEFRKDPSEPTGDGTPCGGLHDHKPALCGEAVVPMPESFIRSYGRITAANILPILS
jgi:hypothetical protein